MVRAAEWKDLAAVLQVERSSAEAPHWAEREYRQALDSQESSVPRRLLVAEFDGVVVGFAVGMVCAGVGELENVAVARDARRRGVGRALCLAVLDWCRESGATGMELEVRAGSAGAIALYEGLGFVRTGLRKRYYRDPAEDAVLMGMELRGVMAVGRQSPVDF